MFAPCVTIKAYFPVTESRDTLNTCCNLQDKFIGTDDGAPAVAGGGDIRGVQLGVYVSALGCREVGFYLL